MSLLERLIYDPVLDAVLDRRGVRLERRRTLARARGRILDVGTGTGLNFPAYSADVRELTTVTLEETLDRAALKRARARDLAIRHVAGDAERLPFTEGSFDTVVCTFLLCSVRRPEVALREFARVLAPGGRLLFLEHVHDGERARGVAQDWVEPLLGLLPFSCSLTRETLPLITASGFALEEVHDHELRALPWLGRRVVRGCARIASEVTLAARAVEQGGVS